MLAHDTLINNPELKILGDTKFRTYGVPLFEMLGYGDFDKRVISYQKDKVFSSSLAIVPAASECGVGRESALRALRERLEEPLREKLQQGHSEWEQLNPDKLRVVLLQRKPGRKRPLVTHEEVVEAIKNGAYYHLVTMT